MTHEGGWPAGVTFDGAECIFIVNRSPAAAGACLLPAQQAAPTLHLQLQCCPAGLLGRAPKPPPHRRLLDRLRPAITALMPPRRCLVRLQLYACEFQRPELLISSHARR